MTTTLPLLSNDMGIKSICLLHIALKKQSLKPTPVLKKVKIAHTGTDGLQHFNSCWRDPVNDQIGTETNVSVHPAFSNEEPALRMNFIKVRVHGS